MRELFNGWKRKTGVVTLVIACVLIAAWSRNQSCSDLFDLKLSTTSSIGAGSLFDSIVLVHRTHANPIRGWFPELFNTVPLSADGSRGIVDPWSEHGENSHIDLIIPGFMRFVDQTHSDGMRTQCWIIADVPIALLFTLVSAYLLISKPRLAKVPDSI